MGAAGSKSKKRSGANSPRQPDPIIFFIDRALGNKKIADALRVEGFEVHIHSDHFTPAERDDHWLPRVGEWGWIVLTKDTRIRYRTTEREALMNANLRAFVLVSGSLSGTEMADIFVKAIPAMKRFLSKREPPFIAKVYKDGSVAPYYPPEEKDTDK